MTAMRTVEQEQVAKSIQSIGIRRVSVQWSFASVLTDSPESQKGDLAGGSCLAQCVLLKTHSCVSAICSPPKRSMSFRERHHQHDDWWPHLSGRDLASRPHPLRRSSYREDAGCRPGSRLVEPPPEIMRRNQMTTPSRGSLSKK